VESFGVVFIVALDDGGFPLHGNPFGPPAPWTVFENPGDAIAFKSLPPQQHRGHRGTQLSGQDPVGQAFAGTEDDINAQHNAARGSAMMSERHQLLSICITQGKSVRRGKRHNHFQYAVTYSISKDISETGD
jgi:hypothetical protein